MATRRRETGSNQRTRFEYIVRAPPAQKRKKPGFSSRCFWIFARCVCCIAAILVPLKFAAPKLKANDVFAMLPSGAQAALAPIMEHASAAAKRLHDRLPKRSTIATGEGIAAVGLPPPPESGKSSRASGSGGSDIGVVSDVGSGGEDDGASEVPDHKRDEMALRVLFQSLGGNAWARRDNWNSDKPLDQWYGVSTKEFTEEGSDDGGAEEDNPEGEGEHAKAAAALGRKTTRRRVVKVDLNDNGVSGTIPSAISDLSFLTEFIMDSNNVRGKIPGSIGDLNKLRTVNLAFNHLTGFVPEEICGLKGLRKLLLDDNNFYGRIPDCIADMNIDLRLGFTRNPKLQPPVPETITQFRTEMRRKRRRDERRQQQQQQQLLRQGGQQQGNYGGNHEETRQQETEEETEEHGDQTERTESRMVGDIPHAYGASEDLGAAKEGNIEVEEEEEEEGEEFDDRDDKSPRTDTKDYGVDEEEEEEEEVAAVMDPEEEEKGGGGRGDTEYRDEKHGKEPYYGGEGKEEKEKEKERIGSEENVDDWFDDENHNEAQHSRMKAVAGAEAASGSKDWSNDGSKDWPRLSRPLREQSSSVHTSPEPLPRKGGSLRVSQVSGLVTRRRPPTRSSLRGGADDADDNVGRRSEKRGGELADDNQAAALEEEEEAEARYAARVERDAQRALDNREKLMAKRTEERRRERQQAVKDTRARERAATKAKKAAAKAANKASARNYRGEDLDRALPKTGGGYTERSFRLRKRRRSRESRGS